MQDSSIGWGRGQRSDSFVSILPVSCCRVNWGPWMFVAVTSSALHRQIPGSMSSRVCMHMWQLRNNSAFLKMWQSLMWCLPGTLQLRAHHFSFASWRTWSHFSSLQTLLARTRMWILEFPLAVWKHLTHSLWMGDLQESSRFKAHLFSSTLKFPKRNFFFFGVNILKVFWPSVLETMWLRTILLVSKVKVHTGHINLHHLLLSAFFIPCFWKWVFTKLNSSGLNITALLEVLQICTLKKS